MGLGWGIMRNGGVGVGSGEGWWGWGGEWGIGEVPPAGGTSSNPTSQGKHREKYPQQGVFLPIPPEFPPLH